MQIYAALRRCNKKGLFSILIPPPYFLYSRQAAAISPLWVKSEVKMFRNAVQ